MALSLGGSTSFSPESQFDRYARGEDIGGQIFGAEIGSFAADPMDLFGGRARLAQEEQTQISQAAADRSIAEMWRQYTTSQNLMEPYSYYGRSALAGFGQYDQDPFFAQQVREGGAALRGSQAASGMLGSSAAGNQLAQFLNALTAEETERQYLQDLNAVRIGQGAVGSIGQASSQLGSGVASTYGQQSQLANLAAQNYGAQRQGSYNQLAGALQGLGSYAAA